MTIFRIDRTDKRHATAVRLNQDGTAAKGTPVLKVCPNQRRFASLAVQYPALQDDAVNALQTHKRLVQLVHLIVSETIGSTPKRAA